MKIAINCIFCHPRGGGIKEYIINLTRNLSNIDKNNDYILYVLKDQFEYASKRLPSRFRVKKIPFKRSSTIKRSLFSQFFWYKEEVTEKFDIFHSPFFYAPRFIKAKIIITVHDLRLYRYPKSYDFKRYVYLKYVVKQSIKRAVKIISISQFTKDEIVDTCKINPEKIIVIHEAIDRDSFNVCHLNGFKLPKEYQYLEGTRFLFSLGHIEPRKNYLKLLEAFRLLKQNPVYSDVKLIIAGKPNLDAEPVISMISQTQDAFYLNYVSREMLLWLYKNATLFIFPSYYEGFGFPPLEAASLGTVSVVSNKSSIPEVCGIAAAAYFNPFDAYDISEKISSSLDNPVLIETKKTFLKSHLDHFSWKKNASETLRIYNDILSL